MSAYLQKKMQVVRAKQQQSVMLKELEEVNITVRQDSVLEQ